MSRVDVVLDCSLASAPSDAQSGHAGHAWIAAGQARGPQHQFFDQHLHDAGFSGLSASCVLVVDISSLAGRSFLPAGSLVVPLGVPFNKGPQRDGPLTERNRRLLELLDNLSTSPDDRDSDWWEEFEATMRRNRMRFRGTEE